MKTTRLALRPPRSARTLARPDRLPPSPPSPSPSPPSPSPSPPPSAFEAFGARSWIVPPATVIGAHHISVDRDCVVLEFSSLFAEAALRLGAGVRLGRFCTIASTVGVTLEEDVAASDGVAILDTWGPFDRADRPIRGALEPPAGSAVVVERGAYVGAGASILPGVRVGRGAYVAEGAVVMDDVAPYSIVAGNPATMVGALPHEAPSDDASVAPRRGRR